MLLPISDLSFLISIPYGARVSFTFLLFFSRWVSMMESHVSFPSKSTPTQAPRKASLCVPSLGSCRRFWIFRRPFLFDTIHAPTLCQSHLFRADNHQPSYPYHHRQRNSHYLTSHRHSTPNLRLRFTPPTYPHITRAPYHSRLSTHCHHQTPS